MKNLWNSFLGSLDNNKDSGFSARKMSAFAGVISAIVVTFYKIPTEYQLEALYAWLVFALACLGIVTAEQVIKFKNGNSEVKQ
jgi:hypothetical protein